MVYILPNVLEAIEQMTDDWCDGQECQYTVMSMRDMLRKYYYEILRLQGKVKDYEAKGD